MPMRLYGYWRSTTSWRVRIALAMKRIDVDVWPVNLAIGEQHEPDYRAVNPSGGVPALVLDDGRVLTQSMAILDYLEEVAPMPALLPGDALARAHVRAAAQVIAADIHPVNNLRVIAHLSSMGHAPDDTTAWMKHWMAEGLSAFERLIACDTPYCFGAEPGLADVCLVPQLYNARRWGLTLSGYTRLTDIEARCLLHPAFSETRPERQRDAPGPSPSMEHSS